MTLDKGAEGRGKKKLRKYFLQSYVKNLCEISESIEQNLSVSQKRDLQTWRQESVRVKSVACVRRAID